MYITAQGCRLRNDLYCVEWDVKLYYTIPYHSSALTTEAQLLLTSCAACSAANTMGVGTNFGVGGRRGESQRAESGGWGYWGGDSEPLTTN